MHVGFILTKTPAEQGFNTFLKFIELHRENQITIYLVGNGVYCATNRDAINRIEKFLNDSAIYATSDDLKARGIHVEHINGISTVNNYDKIVKDIMENFDKILSF